MRVMFKLNLMTITTATLILIFLIGEIKKRQNKYIGEIVDIDRDMLGIADACLVNIPVKVVLTSGRVVETKISGCMLCCDHSFEVGDRVELLKQGNNYLIKTKDFKNCCD
jgi:hypothetical protein